LIQIIPPTGQGNRYRRFIA